MYIHIMLKLIIPQKKQNLEFHREIATYELQLVYLVSRSLTLSLMTENVMYSKICSEYTSNKWGQRHASSDIMSSDITRVDDLEMSAVSDSRNSSLYESRQEHHKSVAIHG